MVPLFMLMTEEEQLLSLTLEGCSLCHVCGFKLTLLSGKLLFSYWAAFGGYVAGPEGIYLAFFSLSCALLPQANT